MNRVSMRRTGWLKVACFCVFSFVLLFLNFYTNFLGSAEQGWFLSFDRSSERGIMGRLVKSRQDGIFSAGGLPIWGLSSATSLNDPNRFFDDKFDNFSAYLNNKKIEYFNPPYYSQIGGQGVFFSILDAVIDFPPAVKLRIFRAVASLLTALAVMAIIAWFYLEFGLFTGVMVLVFALFSQWLTVYGRNLWWSTWAFYLPMVMLMLFFRRTQKNRYRQYFRLGCLVFFSVLIKTIFNGYEFITTALIMMVVPFVYYSILDRVTLVAFFSGLTKIALSTCLAIVVSMCILSFQIFCVTGNFLDGLNHMAYTFQKRTQENYATKNYQLPEKCIEGLSAPTLSVVRKYLKGSFSGFDTGVFQGLFSKFPKRYSVSYRVLVLFFAAMTLALYLLGKRPSCELGSRGLHALVIASWFSLLAPLSWFVVFKAHSYSHLAINFIVWQMPFTFFGAAITGLAVKNCFARLRTITSRSSA